MANFTIMRNGLNTEIVGDPHIGQSSEDVTVEVKDDGTYSGYAKRLYYSYCYHNELHRALSAVNSNNEFIIPVQAFFEPGMVKLSVELSNGTNCPACNACFLIVTDGAKDVDTSVLPSEKTWQSYIQSYIKSDVYALESRIDNANSRIDDANSRIDDAQSGIKTTNSRIDNLIVSSGSDSSAEVIDARNGYDGTTYDTLGTAIRTQVNNLKEDLKHLLNYDTHSEIKFEQGSINSVGEWIESSTRVRTKAPVSANIGDYITIKDSKYIFRLFYNYNDKVVIIGDWTTTFKFSTNKDKVWLVVAKANSSEITPSEAESIVFDTNIEGYIITERKIITDTTLTKEGQVADAKATGDMIDEIRNSVKINHYNLNNVSCGAENQIWSWWYYPQVISFNRVRNKIYWGYTTSDGYTGIAEYDLDTETTKKNNLKISDIDDHNGLAIYVYDDGTIICAYAGGHNTDKQMHIRVSTAKECIDHFDNEIALDSTGYTSYGQFIYYSGKLFLFYRINNLLWAYRYTEDKGTSWSEEVVLIEASVQYYCKFVPTTTDGVIRVCMYSNPGADDNAIRQAFFHLDTLTLYDSDNSTMLGKSNVVNTNVTILIDIENAFSTQRLFDVAITNINRPLILYAPFNINFYNDSVYKVYDNGTVITICNGGEALWHPKYQGGASWIDVDKIVSIRGSNGYDVVELYDYSNGAVTLKSTLYSEIKGNIPIRNARPIVDINKKALLWHRGYYNVANYTDFNSDAKLYTIIDGKIRN